MNMDLNILVNWQISRPLFLLRQRHTNPQIVLSGFIVPVKASIILAIDPNTVKQVTLS